jgi:hypothetical protein
MAHMQHAHKQATPASQSSAKDMLQPACAHACICHLLAGDALAPGFQPSHSLPALLHAHLQIVRVHSPALLVGCHVLLGLT